MAEPDHPGLQRLTKRAEAIIANTYLAGTNTRRVRRALAGLFGGKVGKDAVSRAWRKVKTDWESWQARDLSGEDIVRLILDGTGVKARLDGRVLSIPLLVVLGVRRDGQKVLLAVKNMGGETEAAWRHVLEDLLGRGLKAPELLIVDGGKGLEAALATMPNSDHRGADGVDQHGALANQQIPRPVQHQDALLLDGLHRHKAHGWASDCLTDGCGVLCIVLAALHVSPHIVWWHQLDLMTKLDQLPRPVMRGGTRLHTDQAGRLFLEQGQYLTTADEEAALAAVIIAGPEPERDGVCAWTRADLCRWLEERFAKTYHPSSMTRVLRRMGFSRQKARPSHPRRDAEAQERFKKGGFATS